MSKPSIFTRLSGKIHPHDPEKAPTPRPLSSAQALSEAATYNGPREDTQVNIEDRLAYFRRLVGIDHAPTLNVASVLNRPASNVGIYTRVVNAEAKAKHLYKVFSLLINGCLGLQLVVAAALTALGAANGSRGAVTVFGAINTIIAGFLTYLKGSGLPNRFKYFQTEWRKLREYIEQRERQLGMAMCTLDPEEEARLIEIMYENTRNDVEANAPDSYQSVNRHHRSNIGIGNTPAALVTGIAGDPRRFTAQTLADRAEAAMSKELEVGKQAASGIGAQAQQGVNDQMQRIQGGVLQGQQQAASGLEKGLQSLHSGLEALNRRFEHGREQGASQLDRGRSELEKGKADLEHGKQEVESGVGRGVAMFEQGLQRLDDRLERIGLHRHHGEDKDKAKETPKPEEKDPGPGPKAP